MYPRFLASSADPTGQTLSLTIESLSKVVIGFVTFLAVAKGLNVNTATTQVQAIIDLIAQSAPIVYTLWHTMQMVFGLVRKLISYLKSSPVQPI